MGLAELGLTPSSFLPRLELVDESVECARLHADSLTRLVGAPGRSPQFLPGLIVADAPVAAAGVDKRPVSRGSVATLTLGRVARRDPPIDCGHDRW